MDLDHLFVSEIYMITHLIGRSACMSVLFFLKNHVVQDVLNSLL